MKKMICVDSLWNIMERLKGCGSLVRALREVAENSSIPEEALGGIYELLEMICRDVQADIDSAGEGQVC